MTGSDAPFKEYCCSYRLGGKQWGINILAQSHEDAKMRLRAIGISGVVDGELIAKIPAYPGAGIVVRVRTFFANLFGGRNG